ncbi:MAG TPA: tyrosine recombinase XerC [Clostridiaceae bacterium]|jgi:site-specific recombinase XerD|nr:tyrosine recombinase XerC [Clostridiaceae bacterium]
MINIENNPVFLNSFLDYTATILNKSPNTVKEYNYDLNTFLKFIMYHFRMTDEKEIKNINIHDMSIETLKKVTLDDIHAFLFYLSNNYQSKAATRARKVSSIRVFFNYLSNKTNLLDKNPAQNLETPKLEKRMPKYLTLDDSKKLLETAMSESDRNKERDFAIITLFLNCGMRLSELVGINIKDINFKDEKMNVIGKGNKERTIYLNKACLNAVEGYIKVRPKDGVKFDSRDALFLSERKERISNRTVQYIVKQELRKSGLDINKYSVHKLRHTAATLMYKYGNVDIRALQELLGHESISTTEIYTHVDNSQIRKAVESNPLANM